MTDYPAPPPPPPTRKLSGIAPPLLPRSQQVRLAITLIVMYAMITLVVWNWFGPWLVSKIPAEYQPHHMSQCK